jgi:methylated-DNA-protein-cysteine methyltransferase-like protein
MKEDFFTQVYEVVSLIPEGRVTTYGAIARFLGTARSSRMVGWAMNQSHKTGINIPAHRVVNRNGILTGKHHFETPTTMQEKLENEGIKVINDCIVNFHQHFWDPAVELKL